MKLLINDKEIAQYLASVVKGLDKLQNLEVQKNNLNEALEWSVERKDKQKFHSKIKERITQAVDKDLRNFVIEAQKIIAKGKKTDYNLIRQHVEYLIDKIGIEEIFENYKNSNKDNFVKTTGFHLDSNATLVRRKEYIDFSEDCLFRNMDGNENMLLQKINNKWPFWFIDTGYTNFLHGKNKVWHRLIRNDLHHSNFFQAPVDRLGVFAEFPRPWRTGGDRILIIEPGNFCAKTFGIDIEQWKNDTIAELRKYTDKKIVIREKLSKKIRKGLYQELCDEDYYCVVSINSNASTESLWAGIPAITLKRHITNPVTRNQLSQINDLWRGNLAEWLACLSYCQFTYEELTNGTAAKIVEQYYV